MRKLLLFVALLAMSCMAVADTVTMKFVGVGPGSAGGPNIGGGVYAYPYYFSINGSATTTPLICDDYDSHVYIGETWQANVTSLTAYAGNQTPVASLGISKERAYQEAAWLLYQLQGTPTQATAVAVNYALWGIFSNAALSSSAYATSGAANWLNQAYAATASPLSDEFLANFKVYTPIAGTQSGNYGLPQEFIGYSPVPEPASLMMLGSGILGVFGLKKRRGNK